VNDSHGKSDTYNHVQSRRDRVNPQPVHFCYRDDGDLALIYEVRNTFGDIHAYVLPCSPRPSMAAGAL